MKMVGQDKPRERNTPFSFLDIKEDLYKAVIKNALEGFIILSLEGDILDTNEAFSKMHGYSRDEILSMKVYDLAPTKITLNDYTELIKDHIKMGGANFETRHRCKDGRVIDVLVSSKYLDVAGGIFFSFHRDITDQKKKQRKEKKHLKQTEQTLEETKDRLITVSQSISDIIMVLDEDGRYIDILTSSEDLLYRERERIIGLLLRDVLPEDVANAGLKSIKKAIKTNKTQTIEYKLDVPAGERWFEGRISPLKSIGDKKLVVMVARDITERKQAQEKHRLIIQTTADGFWVSDLEGKLLEVNDSYCDMIGYTQEELLKMHIWNIEVKENTEDVIRHIQRLREKGHVHFETKHKRKDGRIIDVDVSSNFLDFGEGQVFSFLHNITERKEQDYQLKKANAEYLATINTTGDIIIRLDKDNKIKLVNDGACKFFGLSREEMLSGKFGQHIHPDDRDCTFKLHEQVVSTGKPSYGFVNRQITPFGERFVEWNSFPFFDENGRYYGKQSTGRDITERKKAEEDINNAYSEIDQIFETAADGLCLIDKDFNILRVNEAFSNLFGISNSEATSKKCYEIMDDSRCRTNNCSLRYILNGKKRFECEVEKRYLNGNTVQCIITATPYRRYDGEIIGIVENIKDVSQLKLAEKKYEIILETAIEGFFILSIDGLNSKFIEVNDSYCQMMGNTREELLGMSFSDIEAVESAEDISKHGDKIIKKGYDHFETKHRCKDGKLIDVEISVNYLNQDGGQFFGFIRDITERKAYEKKLHRYQLKLEREVTSRTLELQKELDGRAEFTRALVHELKTPLTPILTASEILIDDLKEEPWSSCAAKINKGILSLNRRINDLFDLARSELATIILNYSLIDVKQMLTEILEYMREEANKKRLSLFVKTPILLPKLEADADRLQQVILNLLENSFKYTPKGGEIILKVRQKGNALLFEVKDTGSGISAEEQEFLFKPYHRSKKDREKLGGLGLGLALCKILVEMHGGQIWVKSKIGKGSSFMFSLPLCKLEMERSS